MKIQIFKNNGFILLEKYKFNSKYYSYVFLYDDTCIIIDECFDFEENKEFFFDYSKYCEMQNKYMFTYSVVLRFNLNGNEEKIIEDITSIMNYETHYVPDDNGGSFSNSHVDNTPTEAIFEDVFVAAYGSIVLECLHKEVSLSNDFGKNYFIDYVIETKAQNYAFEINGVKYHHPCLVGEKKYNELLHKQNTINILGYKLYRFSTDNLHFRDKTIQELKSFLPEKDEFIPKPIIKNNRGLVLYNHQTDILNKLDIDRLNGKSTALIVIPTASGKSEICITDLSKNYIKKEVRRVLVMVPSIKVKEDWNKRIAVLKSSYEIIDVLFYNTVYCHKNFFSQDYYDYIIFDESHHAQASNCRATIQYFKPKYLIGLTATDERLDQKKLEDVFGNYEVKLTLEEAINTDVVTNIRAYRLMSNINLKEVRFNGKDYNSSDLERSLIINSRNELIGETLVKYFSPKIDFYKQGIVFCVNKDHTKKIAKILNDMGLTAEAVYGGNSRNGKIFDAYENKKLQFICSCQIISEGWDSPQTEIVVMARPTLSKVLYLQQLGRGLRKYPGKECLYLIDVVDNYSAKLLPWNFNSLFHIAKYSPFMGIKNNHLDYLSILGLSEKEISMSEIDVFSFEEKYKDYMSLEQTARELYVGTNTLSKWNKKKEYASLYLPIGNKNMPYFSKEDIIKIRLEKKLSVHTDETILDDFLKFIDDNVLTFSFKLIFIISCLKFMDKEGNVNLSTLCEEYKRFYVSRIKKGLQVDKANCIYNLDNLNDVTFIKRSILSNPFEKFERKRFLYHSKDLNLISFNNSLFSKMTKTIKNDILNKEIRYLQEYYEKYGGYDYDYKF